MTNENSRFLKVTQLFAMLGFIYGLVGCGGGDSIDTSQSQSVSQASSLEDISVSPVYQLAPVMPPSPTDIDKDGSDSSALQTPSKIESNTGLSTKSLKSVSDNSEQVNVAATASSYTFYTPAQIKSLYGFSSLTNDTKFAYQGSGQTIAVIGAYHNPTITNDVNTFSSQFGLPTCTSVSTTSTMISSGKYYTKPTLGNPCSFQIIYANSSGNPVTTTPVVNSGWAVETSMDVQWAHAIAPKANIVLIEATDSSVNALLGAISLANKIGANVVTMSFGANEGSWISSIDTVFDTSQTVYVAASGDNGVGVSWPAVSTKVLAVGGTQLTSTTTPRAEVAWSGSGGGVSSYVSQPTWQNSLVKSLSTTKRVVPDISYNSSPNSGYYVYMSANSQTGSVGGWYGVGGTSAASPQIAGMIAVLNAKRVNVNKSINTSIQTLLYSNIASVAGNYSVDFKDITSGSNGNCSTCSSKTGYDAVTGLGTPNANYLINYLTNL
jgi:subtilase family serine protease